MPQYQAYLALMMIRAPAVAQCQAYPSVDQTSQQHESRMMLMQKSGRPQTLHQNNPTVKVVRQRTAQMMLSKLAARVIATLQQTLNQTRLTQQPVMVRTPPPIKRIN